MLITKKQLYAILVMICLSLRSKEEPIALSQLAQSCPISSSYLEQIFAKLKEHDLVKSVRGPGGGYVVNDKLDDISIRQILDAIQKNTLLPNLPKSQGEDSEHCEMVRKICMTLYEQVNGYLDTLTLKQLIADTR